jgi:hypothetical protein
VQHHRYARRVASEAPLAVRLRVALQPARRILERRCSSGSP